MSQRSVTPQEMETRYRRAEAIGISSYKPQQLVFNAKVEPHWIEGSDYFWYIRESKTDKDYRLVNAKAASNAKAFDHQALGNALSKAAKKEVDVNKLPLDQLELSLSPLTVRFSAFEKRWVYTAAEQSCCEIETVAKNEQLSPDGSQVAFFRHCNLWVRDLGSGKEKLLTFDGARHYRYAATASEMGRQEPLTLEIQWSPDSKRIFTLVIDTRHVKVGPPLVRHVPPPEAGLRPDIIDPDRRVAWLGDEHREAYTFLCIDVDSGHHIKADYPACCTIYPAYTGYFSGKKGWWSPDSRRAYFVDLSNGSCTARLIEFDTRTGATRALIEETSDTRVNMILSNGHAGLVLQPLADGKELVWYSERSGWGHLYLYDLASGQLKHPITQGEWVVHNILHSDIDKRELLIQTAGRIPERHPYYRDICRVNIDSGELTPLLSTDHEYVICNHPQRLGAVNDGVSPTGNYLVTTRSRVNDVPFSLLLDRHGTVVLELETADISGLPKEWQWPEPVKVNAADGHTDLYGVVFRPSHFSEQQSYPVLDFSELCHGIPTASFDGNSDRPMAFAELGFIVVMIRSRGRMTNGLRHRAFQSDRDAALISGSHQDDCVAGILQLAEKYPYMDSERVGVGALSVTGPGLNGLFRYPDFYKVGVSLSCWDMRLCSVSASEMFSDGQLRSEAMSPLLDQTEQVKKFNGKLLLIHGMLSNVVPVAATFRVVEALQKANKDFDLLLLPNHGHATSCPYVLRRTCDYFVQHLLGVDPPKNFAFSEHHFRADPSQDTYLLLLDDNI